MTRREAFAQLVALWRRIQTPRHTFPAVPAEPPKPLNPPGGTWLRATGFVDLDPPKRTRPEMYLLVEAAERRRVLRHERNVERALRRIERRLAARHRDRRQAP